VLKNPTDYQVDDKSDYLDQNSLVENITEGGKEFQ